MSTDIADQYINFFYLFWLGALPLLLGLWIIKRWIYD